MAKSAFCISSLKEAQSDMQKAVPRGSTSGYSGKVCIILHIECKITSSRDPTQGTPSMGDCCPRIGGIKSELFLANNQIIRSQSQKAPFSGACV